MTREKGKVESRMKDKRRSSCYTRMESRSANLVNSPSDQCTKPFSTSASHCHLTHRLRMSLQVNIIQYFIHPDSLILKKKTREREDIMSLSRPCLMVFWLLPNFLWVWVRVSLIHSIACTCCCVFLSQRCVQPPIQVLQHFPRRWHQCGLTKK